jgi:hypothetical protein
MRNLASWIVNSARTTFRCLFSCGRYLAILSSAAPSVALEKNRMEATSALSAGVVTPKMSSGQNSFAISNIPKPGNEPLSVS